MTPEKHLAAILTAWHETDSYTITDDLAEALHNAERDFDGVEADSGLCVDFDNYSFRREAVRRLDG